VGYVYNPVTAELILVPGFPDSPRLVFWDTADRYDTSLCHHHMGSKALANQVIRRLKRSSLANGEGRECDSQFQKPAAIKSKVVWCRHVVNIYDGSELHAYAYAPSTIKGPLVRRHTHTHS
jgi:hypothetical protein